MNLPNRITLFRLCLAPLFILFFFLGRIDPSLTFAGKVGAILVAFLFELTDFLDGYIARRRGLVTELGKFLDPFADSVSRFTVFLCFLGAGYAEIWMAAIIFYRDSLVANLRIAAASRNLIIAARSSGKIKALVQGAAIFLILVLDIARSSGLDAAGTHFAQVCFWSMTVVTIVTGLSAVDYIAGNRQVIKSMKS